MLCCISNQVPTEPVVSKTTGCLFERRLIEAYLKENGRCPKTGQSMQLSDLIAVVAVATPKTAPSVSSIPALLESLHHEWDSLMLEQFTLRQQVTTLQQELSHALFQHDAACRVIASLIQERDSLKKQVPTTAKASTVNEEEEEASVLPETVCMMIDSCESRLSEARKHRDPPREYATLDMLHRFVETGNSALHDGHAATCVDALELPSRTKIVVCGGADGKIVRYDATNRHICGIGVGHQKTVREVKDLGDIIVSCADDATVRVWRSEGDAITDHLVLKPHQAAVNGFCVLPTSQHLISIDGAGKIVLSDIVKGFSIHSSENEHTRLGLSCIALHPDGAICATGASGSVLLWDIKMMDAHVKLTPPSRPSSIPSVAFNDDGVTLVASSNTGVVTLWDLRKSSSPLVTLPPTVATSVRKVAFDPFGSYLAIAGHDLRLVDWKKGVDICTLSSHMEPLTSVSWGGTHAQWIATTSLDKTTRVYGIE